MRFIGWLGISSLIIIYTALQIISISIYFNGFMNLKISKKRFFLIVFVFTGLFKLIPDDMNPFSRVLFFISFLGLCIFIFFYGSVAKKIYHIIFFTLITTLADLILSIVVKNLMLNSQVLFMASFVANFISLLIVVLCIKLLLYFKENSEIGLSNTEYALLCIIPCLSLISIYMIAQLNYMVQFVSCIFLLVNNICISVIYNSLIRKNLLLYKYNMIETQNIYYKESLRNQKEIQQLKHDLKNILVSFAYCLEHQQVEKVKKQIQEILNSKAFSSPVLTGCLPLDAILNSKIEVINEYKIEYDIDLQVPNDIVLQNEVDLVAIIGNALDNSIEGVLRLPDNIKKKIIIHIKFHEEKLFINIINSSKKINIDLNKETLLSEKRKNAFGIGVSSIKDRVSKLKGYYDFSYNSGLFHVMIVLPA